MRPVVVNLERLNKYAVKFWVCPAVTALEQMFEKSPVDEKKALNTDFIASGGV